MVSILSTAVLGTLVGGGVFLSSTLVFSEPTTTEQTPQVGVAPQAGASGRGLAARRQWAWPRSHGTVESLWVQPPSRQQLPPHAFRLQHQPISVRVQRGVERHTGALAAPTTTRSFFSTMSFCPRRVFRTKVRLCSPGSRPSTVKVTFPTPPANTDAQVQLVERSSALPGTGCDSVRQIAASTISMTQYWQESGGGRRLAAQTREAEPQLVGCGRYRHAVELLVVDGPRQLHLFSSDHLVRNRDVHAERQTDGHLNRIGHADP